MTIKDIQDKLPGAEVHNLETNSAYIILVSRNEVTRKQVQELGEWATGKGLKVAVLMVDNVRDAMRILELKEG